VTTLDDRALNRALLARQLLLERHEMSAADAIGHLVGLQAQEPQEPYVGLWSRLVGFQPDELVELLESRAAVRTQLMRRTLHLVTAQDCLTLRPLHQPMLRARMLATLRREMPDVDLIELGQAGRPLFEEQPRTLSDAGRALVDRWPGVPARVLGDAVGSLVPLVQVPPRGLWGRRGQAINTTVEAWLGQPLAESTSEALDELILRYLAAYGPAAAADIRAWSGLSGLQDSLARLRPDLRTFRDGRGRTLLDLPDAPLPDPRTPAPPRFLPAFDNAVLGFDDRSRIIDVAHRRLSVAGARFVLVDGRVGATWTVVSDETTATLRIAPLVRLRRRDTDAMVAEGRRLLAFLAATAKRRPVEVTD
jgi:Winged helix DNA-binding domain